MTPIRLVIPRTAFDAMLAHARSVLPNECCGFLAGIGESDVARVSEVHPLVNSLASRTEFETEPRSLFAAYRAMRTTRTDVLAIYHSHPTSEPVPSQKDLTRNTYGPNVAWVIIGFADSEPDVRVWWLTESGFTVTAWNIAEDA